MLYTENNPNCDGYGYYDHRRSSGVAKAGLATAIPAAAAGILNLFGGNGLLGGNQNGNMCSENYPINRYEDELMHENMNLKAEADHGKISCETNDKILQLYKYVVDENKAINQKLSDQRVINEHNSCMIDGLTDAMKRQREEMYSLVHTEAVERNNADARTVDYANCTFAPQIICGIKCDPDPAYRKPTHNPFSGNGGYCGCGTVLNSPEK